MATLANSLLLDTTVVIRHFRAGSAIEEKLAGYSEIYLPYVALAELYAGAFRSARPEENRGRIIRFLEAVTVLLPDEKTPEIYGLISAQLANGGTPIPQNDIWIAASALQFGLPLATTDKHFGNINGLTLIPW
jgi:tRNA(fMet)-specific endonuclease VapC